MIKKNLIINYAYYENNKINFEIWNQNLELNSK